MIPPTDIIKIHYIPDDWKDLVQDTERNEPPFELVDNPNKYSSHSFLPVFKKEVGSRTYVYKHHYVPTECILVDIICNLCCLQYVS